MLKNKYSDLNTVLKLLRESQSVEDDMREASREAKHFVTKRDGQWDPEVWRKLDGRFRGTFDMCGPIIDNITGEIEKSDFTSRVSPAGGQASEQIAKTFDGLIRNIRNISNAETVFNRAGRNVVIGGFDAWEIVQDYVDADAFDQDLFIRHIPNAVDNVWFDVGATEQDKSDAEWAVILTAITKDDYNAQFPEGSKLSVGDGRDSEYYWDKADTINVGRILYKKPVDIDIVRMSNGKVYNADELESVLDELALQGIVEEKRRTRKSHVVYSRMFDGGDWLTKEEKTVFSHLPVIPVYGNYDIVENKTIFYGKIEKLMDQQRVLNYALSRDIEDGALSPKPYIQMTDEQLEGFEADYEKMNIDNKPIRRYNHVDGQPVPHQVGGVQVSTGLQTTVANMQQMIASTANAFNAQQGNANPTQSGVAGAQQIEQANIGNTKWFKALEIAITQTGKVLVDAIPKVYDSTRQVRILEEDGKGRMITLNEQILDTQTGQIVELNNLAQGDYDVITEVGPAFANQQRETSQAFMELAAIDPTILQQNKDILLRSQQSPGMDQAADRARKELFNAGLIPQSQWTDEERAEYEQQQALAAQQPPQEDPMMVAARAEEIKGQAQVLEAQNKQADIQGKQQLDIAKLQLEQQKLQLDAAKFEREKDDKYNVDLINADQNQQKIDLQAQKQVQELSLKLTELEQKIGQQLNSEVQSNMLVFNPQTGEFE